MRNIPALPQRWARTAAVAVGAAVALMVVAACAGSTPASTPPSAAPSSAASIPAASASGASASGAVISTADGANGAHLVGPSGKTVYLWMADTSSTSTCSGACAAAWPPVTTNGAPTASGSAVTADLGTTKRADGAEQVTYHGHPLYYFAGDSDAGQTNGQDNNGFGALWWIVAPSGAAITAAAPTGSSGMPSSSSPYAGY